MGDGGSKSRSPAARQLRRKSAPPPAQPPPGLRVRSPWPSGVRVSRRSRWTARSSEGRGEQLWLSGVFYFKHIAAAALKFAASTSPLIPGSGAGRHFSTRLPRPLPAEWRGALRAAGAGGGFPIGGMWTRGLCERECAPKPSLLGAPRAGEKSGIQLGAPSCFRALPLGFE